MASIKRRPDGMWRARYRDESGKEHAKHFPRKVDAQAWLDEITTSVVTGAYVDPNAGKVSFAVFYADWSARQIWVGATRRGMDISAASVEFGALPLRTIRRSHLEVWVKGMTVRGLAASTVATRFNNVRGVLRAAVKDQLIARDPAEGVTLPRLRKAEAAMVLPTPAQIRSLLDAAGESFAPVVALAAFAGLRAGEIRGLQLGDVAFLARTLEVRRQAQRPAGRDGQADVRPPKYSSERTVFLPDKLCTILSRHVAARSITEPAAWLFPGRRAGQPVHELAMRERWDAAKDAAKVTGVRMHDLRHFYASGLIAAGCDVVTVQRALGHSSATVTLSTYAHLWPTAEDRTRRAAGELLSAVLRGPGADQEPVIAL